ncbi:hypothetical protein DPMN_000940 [Dreissena polymorpha]|uniref:Uncharacterized protein n=1 Tax=Dreissena polymorpha TaxID=45954 RepID=A0A9D4MJ87_DREPO|nr:hypothetical protein DPMN_000940 [Dreissena polymorpha]
MTVLLETEEEKEEEEKKEEEEEDDNDEIVCVQTSNLMSATDSLFIVDCERFSSYRKLIRTTAYVYRFVRNCRSTPETRQLGCISVNEMNFAEKALIRSLQNQSYNDVMTELNKSTALRVQTAHLFSF